jgi:hypothetical protein
LGGTLKIASPEITQQAISWLKLGRWTEDEGLLSPQEESAVDS